MKSLCGLVILSCYVFYAEALSVSSSNIFPTREVCGEQLSTEVGMFPWVVYIPVEPRTNNPDAHIRCTGTLINKRYVITNKSCLQFVLTKVHLGQFDITNNNNVQKVNIESRVIDEKFEIVLLRLAKDIEFTDRIRPICLPFDDFDKAETGSVIFTSGYGLVATGTESQTKKKVEQILISDEDCQKAKTEPKVAKNPFCVKLKTVNAIPACTGDEGSPAMYLDDGKWVLYGVLIGLFENGSKPCATYEPAIGFKITDEVIQWMVANMRT